MNFCNTCGSPVELKVPADDYRPRHVCTRCATIHYQNPKIVTGCIPEHEDEILLCRRAIEPRAGLWTLPAGFMELGETAVEGAVRETLEEANARVAPGALYAVFNLPHISQVYMMFRSRLLNRDFSPGAESTEVALFTPGSIPWDELAFPVIRHTLEFFVSDQRRGKFVFRSGKIVKEAGRFSFMEEPALPGDG